MVLSSGGAERFDYLLVANGHHWDPRYPSYPGRFGGRFLHSHDYKRAAPFVGQRVLVIGGGNSACDIAVETARVSSATAITMRRGYHFVPKFLFGLPSDVLYARLQFLPRGLRAWLLQLLLRVVNGRAARYGLPEADHRFLSSHPVVNSEFLYFIRHGRIHPRPDVARFEGRQVRFADGRVEAYDAVIAATGFKISFPFFDPSLVDFAKGEVPLYLRVFHPHFRDLFFIGLFQPLGCIWPLAELQARLVANFIVGNYRLPDDLEARIGEELGAIARKYLPTPRHTVEVDSHPFRRALLREIPRHAPTWPEPGAGQAARAT